MENPYVLQECVLMVLDRIDIELFSRGGPVVASGSVRPASHMVGLVVFVSFMLGCADTRDELIAEAAEALKAGHIDRAHELYLHLLRNRPVDLDAIAGMVETTKIDPTSDEHVYWCKKLIELRPWNRYANIVVAEHLLEHNNINDAINRLVMAYQESDFAAEKQEIKQLLDKIHEQIVSEYLESKEQIHDATQESDQP